MLWPFFPDIFLRSLVCALLLALSLDMMGLAEGRGWGWRGVLALLLVGGEVMRGVDAELNNKTSPTSQFKSVGLHWKG